MEYVRHISDLTRLPAGLAALLAGVIALLVLATLGRAARLAMRPTEVAEERWRSIGSWWVLLALVVAMVLLGRWAVLAVMTVLGGLAARESARLAERTSARRGLAVTLPLSGPGFAVLVAWLPPSGLAADGLTALVLLLVLTELNDIAQAWWGRTLGAHAMAPVLSPNKTWEGLAGGVATTTAAAVLVAPPLLGLGPAQSGLLGVLLGLGGVAGDLLASRLKRAAGADDSGTLLPGQGGVLDRLDSLTVNAPAYLALLWVYAGAVGMAA